MEVAAVRGLTGGLLWGKKMITWGLHQMTNARNQVKSVVEAGWDIHQMSNARKQDESVAVVVVEVAVAWGAPSEFSWSHNDLLLPM